jgi:hypothetical protein
MLAASADLEAPAPAARHLLDLPAQALASIGRLGIFVIMCLVVAESLLRRPW